MKKMMTLAALVTITGSAYAACTLPTDLYCAQVYDVKVSLKTTVSKTKVDCEEICYRTKGSASLKGYLYACDCTCDGFRQASLYLYDKKNDRDYYGIPAWLVLNRIGKKNTDAEGFMVAPLSSSDDILDGVGKGIGSVFYLAGFGKFDDDGYLKNMSGDIVGILPPPICAQDCSVGTYAVAYPACYLAIVGEATQPIYLVPTVGFGTWSLRYNKHLSEDYANGTWMPPFILPPI